MAYLLFMEHHILPNEFAALPPQVKAFLYASFAKQQEDVKKAREEVEKQSKMK